MKWAYAGIVPAAFVTAFVALAGLAAPEHDDYCFAIRSINDGMLPTIVHFYTELTGRITALVIIQLPQVIASALSISLLSAYPMVVTVMVTAGIVGVAVAMGCAWRARGARLTLLVSTFVATAIAVAPSPHELIFWLPGIACYVPPAVVALLFLAIASRSERISPAQTAGLACAGFIVSMCNEFTAVWLLLILLLSLGARQIAGVQRQPVVHGMIAAAVLAGFGVILAAPGNAGRRGDLPNSGNLRYAIIDGLVYSIGRLLKFMAQPAVIVCIAVAVVVTMSCRQPAALDRRRATFLAAAIVAVCGLCCYLEFFVYGYSTGGRLVERAENQALILLLFGVALAASKLARVWLPSTIHVSPGIVIGLAVATSASLYASPTGRLLRNEAGSFMSFHREALERDHALRTSAEIVPVVARHKATPSLLMGVDADVNSGCLARYYGKTGIHVEARTSP